MTMRRPSQHNNFTLTALTKQAGSSLDLNPTRGCVAVAPYDYPDVGARFSDATFLTSTDALDALASVTRTLQVSRRN